MSLSERAEKLQAESKAALVFLPGSAKSMINELLALVRDLAAAIEKRGSDGNKTA